MEISIFIGPSEKFGPKNFLQLYYYILWYLKTNKFGNW